MNRRHFIHGLTASSALTLVGAAAFAASYADAVVSQLTKQGFYNIAVQTTLLGRVRILADRGDGQREIILNPRTGEILRDTWQASATGDVMPIIDDVKEVSDGNTSGSDGSGSDGSGSDGSGSDGSGGDSSGDGGSGSGGGDDHSGSGSGSDDHSDGNDTSGGEGSDNSGDDSGGGKDDKKRN